MAKLIPVQASADREEWHFQCPGCCGAHFITTKGERPLWQWNGDLERPTVTPSILVTLAGARCHLFIRDGNIQFLDDCDHALKGQTVPLPDWEE